MLQDTQESDAIADQEVALILLWEQTAREDSRSCHGTHSHFEPLFVSNPFADVHIRTGSAGSIVGELVAPLVEDIAVWVGSDREMEFHFEGSRVESVHTAFTRSNRFGRRFHRGDVKNTPGPVEPAIGSHQHRVCRVVRVGATDSLEHSDLKIRFVVPVGVLEEPNLWEGGNQHATVPEFETGDAIELVGESDTSVGQSVTIVIGQANDFVATGLGRIPVWVRRPNRGKESSIGIDSHLNRVNQLGKHLFAGKEIDFHALGNLHLPDRFFATEILVFAFGKSTRNIGFDR